MLLLALVCALEADAAVIAENRRVTTEAHVVMCAAENKDSQENERAQQRTLTDGSDAPDDPLDTASWPHCSS